MRATMTDGTLTDAVSTQVRILRHVEAAILNIQEAIALGAADVSMEDSELSRSWSLLHHLYSEMSPNVPKMGMFPVGQHRKSWRAMIHATR